MAAVGGRPFATSIYRQFEDLAASYRSECAHGVPMSVHERYQRQLGFLRDDLRGAPTACHLGEVLKRMGAVDDRRLADALGIQASSGGEKLLGEILIDLGWASEQTIRQAVEMQAEASVVGANREWRNSGDARRQA